MLAVRNARAVHCLLPCYIKTHWFLFFIDCLDVRNAWALSVTSFCVMSMSCLFDLILVQPDQFCRLRDVQIQNEQLCQAHVSPPQFPTAPGNKIVWICVFPVCRAVLPVVAVEPFFACIICCVCYNSHCLWQQCCICHVVSAILIPQNPYWLFC